MIVKVVVRMKIKPEPVSTEYFAVFKQHLPELSNDTGLFGKSQNINGDVFNHSKSLADNTGIRQCKAFTEREECR